MYWLQQGLHLINGCFACYFYLFLWSLLKVFSSHADTLYKLQVIKIKRWIKMPVVPPQMSDEFDQDSEQGVALETRPKTKRPPLYKVLILNDDYTPMEFVVVVLERFFGKNHTQAFEIMLTVHKKGMAVVGVFSHEIAETKVAQVMDFSRRHQHPLQCTMEKE